MTKVEPTSYDFPPGVPDIPQEIADHRENVRELRLLIERIDRRNPLDVFLQKIGVGRSDD